MLTENSFRINLFKLKNIFPISKSWMFCFLLFWFLSCFHLLRPAIFTTQKVNLSGSSFTKCFFFCIFFSHVISFHVIAFFYIRKDFFMQIKHGNCQCFCWKIYRRGNENPIAPMSWINFPSKHISKCRQQKKRWKDHRGRHRDYIAWKDKQKYKRGKKDATTYQHQMSTRCDAFFLVSR